MKNVFILFLMVSFVVSGCVSYDHYYKLDEQYLARRQLETRRYDTNDEEALLVASAQVLQDLGFTLDESETKLGLLTASKDREAGSAGEAAAQANGYEYNAVAAQADALMEVKAGTSDAAIIDLLNASSPKAPSTFNTSLLVITKSILPADNNLPIWLAS